MTRTVMRKYIDYLEDMECLRISKPETAKANVTKEIMKLVPENFKISMLPTFFNNTDAERIGTVIKDTTSDFLINTPKKVMFSIALKVYPYNHSVCSVRVVLVKLHAFEGAAVNDIEEETEAEDPSQKDNKKDATKTKDPEAGKEKKELTPQDIPPKK